MSQSTGNGETCYLLFVDLPYSRLFWRAIKLANWSKNVIGKFQFGEYVRAARDPVAHYYAHDYASRARVCVWRNFGDLLKNSPIRQIKIPAKVSGCTVCSSEMPTLKHTAQVAW